MMSGNLLSCLLLQGGPGTCAPHLRGGTRGGEEHAVTRKAFLILFLKAHRLQTSIPWATSNLPSCPVDPCGVL